MVKHFISLAFLIGLSLSSFAQKVEVDLSSGLIRVNGEDKFYLTSTNKTLITKDFRLENIDHEELAYLKYQDFNPRKKNDPESEISYLMYFPKTGERCYIDGFSITESFRKRIAKEIVSGI